MLPLSHVFERAWSYYVLYCGAENVYIRDPQKVMDVIGGEAHRDVRRAPPLREGLRHDPGEGRLGPTCAAPCSAGPPGSGQMVAARQAGQIRFSPALRPALALPSAWCFASCAPGSAAARFLPVAGARLADEVNLFFRPWGSTSHGYGMTETTATVCCYEDTRFRLGSIGTALSGIEVKLGENNELLVRAPTVMRAAATSRRPPPR